MVDDRASHYAGRWRQDEVGEEQLLKLGVKNDISLWSHYFCSCSRHVGASETSCIPRNAKHFERRLDRSDPPIDSRYSAVIQVCLIYFEELLKIVIFVRQQLYRDEMMTWNEIIKSSNKTTVINTTGTFYYSKVTCVDEGC